MKGMERKLLLLGLLRAQEMHGYHLNEIIDRHLGMSVHLKKPTAYHLLKQMAQDGWVTHKEEREGSRPPKLVYAITSQGESAFHQLLRESLADYKPAEFISDFCLAFIDAIPAEEVLSLLSKRRSVVEGLLQAASGHDTHPGSLQLVIEHQVRHISTELEWLDEVIARIKRESRADT